MWIRRFSRRAPGRSREAPWSGGGQTITLTKPVAIALGRWPLEGKLLIADNGPLQVLVYDVSGTPKLEFALGAEGGIAASYQATYAIPATPHSSQDSPSGVTTTATVRCKATSTPTTLAAMTADGPSIAKAISGLVRAHFGWRGGWDDSRNR